MTEASNSEMTGAQAIADMLSGYGVSHVFFVPTMLLEALYEIERRTSISRVMAHSEKAAAYMADGYARASGRPGVCFAQTVGAANLASGLRDAYMGSSPVIAMTGGPFRHTRDRHQYQEVNDFPLFEPVTKWNTRVGDVNMIPWALRQAFRGSTAGRPGPVYLEIEGHHGEIEHDSGSFDLAVESRFSHTPPFRSEPEAGALEDVADALATAQRPVLMIGGGARTSDAGAAIIELAERYSIPILASLNAKAVVPAGHPLYIGVVGRYSRPVANELAAEADLTFFVGSKTGSQFTAGWKNPAPGSAVIECDIYPDDIGINYPQAVPLVGDARQCIKGLIDVLASRDIVDRSPWIERVNELQEQWEDEWAPLLKSDQEPIRPERLCTELSDALPENALVVSDTGHAGMWTAGMLELRSSGQDFIRAAGSLGWAFPAAIGAKCGVPDRPVVAFTGDGGYWYHMSELETAVRCGINSVTIVNNNNSLNQEIHHIKRTYEGSLHGQHGDLWTFNNVNFAEIAEAMGAAAFRVEKIADLQPTLKAALSEDRPSVVEVMTDIEALAPTNR